MVYRSKLRHETLGVAFSQAHDFTKKIAVADFSIPANDSATHGGALIAQFDSFLPTVGWTRTGTYENGFVYHLVSPQGFEVDCRIYTPPAWYTDTFKFDSIAVQFVSTDGLREGIRHPIIYDQRYDPLLAPYTDLRIWANCCQLFTWRPGLPPANNSWPFGFAMPLGMPGWCVMGGIPFSTAANLAPNCQPALNPNPAEDVCTEIWWSASDEDRKEVITFAEGAGGHRTCSFRNTPAIIVNFSTCYSGSLRNRYSDTDGAIPATCLRLQYPTVPKPIPQVVVNSRGMQWSNNFGMAYSGGLWCDPMMSWSLQTNTSPRVRALLWDAILNTANAPYENQIIYGTNDITKRNLTWVNYMQNFYVDDGFSHMPSLYLLIDGGQSGTPSGGGSGVGNYVY